MAGYARPHVPSMCMPGPMSLPRVCLVPCPFWEVVPCPFWRWVCRGGRSRRGGYVQGWTNRSRGGYVQGWICPGVGMFRGGYVYPPPSSPTGTETYCQLSKHLWLVSGLYASNWNAFLFQIKMCISQKCLRCFNYVTA